MATTASPGARRALVPRWVDHALLALLAYGPILLSSPGRISADRSSTCTSTPAGSWLARRTLWDSQVGQPAAWRTSTSATSGRWGRGSG